MGWHDRFDERMRARDFDGAVALAKQLFAANRLGDGFAQIVSGFAPQPPTHFPAFVCKKLEAGRSEDADREHTISPFNAIVFRMERLDFGAVDACSVHLDEDGRRWHGRFGFDEVVIGDEAAPDEYGVSLDLIAREAPLTAGGEALVPRDVYYALKAAMFARHLRALAEALCASEPFARFPKALPFRFVMEVLPHRFAEADAWHEIREPLTVASAAPELGALYADAAKPLGTVDAAGALIHAVANPGGEPDARLVDTMRGTGDRAAEIVEVLAGEALDRAIREPGDDDAVAAPGEDLLARARDAASDARPSQLARLLHALDPTRAAGLRDKILASAPPPVPSAMKRADLAPGMAEAWVADVLAVGTAWPETAAHAIRALRESPNPLVRVAWLEKTLPRGQPPAIVRDPPDAYVEAVFACLDVLPANALDSQHVFNWVMDRHEALETRAAAAAGKITQLFEAQCERYPNDLVALAHNFGQVLYWIGMTEIPDGIRAAAARSPATLRAFYPAWEQRVGAKVPPVKKRAATNGAAAKNAEAKQPAAKKPTTKRQAAKKPAAKKPAAKQPAAKKPAAKKPAARRAR